jgi:hypothetical protein
MKKKVKKRLSYERPIPDGMGYDEMMHLIDLLAREPIGQVKKKTTRGWATLVALARMAEKIGEDTGGTS